MDPLGSQRHGTGLQITRFIPIRTVQHVAEEYGIEPSELAEWILSALKKIQSDVPTEPAVEVPSIQAWPANPYLSLKIPVLEHQEVELQTIMPVRCTGKRRWRTIYPPCNDFVFVWMGAAKQYGVLGGRLPAQLNCLMKLRRPTDGKSFRLALVTTFEVVHGGDAPEPHRLVVVQKRAPRSSRRTIEGAGTTFIVPISRILGPARLIPIQPAETTQWFVNTMIDLSQFDSIY